MDNESNSFDVPKVHDTKAIQGLGRHSNDGKEKKREYQPPLKKDTREYFHTLSKAVEASNNYCMKKGYPYRFRVYQENKEVFINLMVLDEQGRMIEEKRKNISEEDFARLIEDVSSIEGLFFDKTA